MRLPQSLPTKFLTPALESLVGTLLSIVPRRDKYTYRQLEEALTTIPVVSAAAEVRVALTLAAMADYTNSVEAVQKEIRAGIFNYAGNWQDDVAKTLTYIPYGFSYTEIAHQVTKAGGAQLKGFRTLNQARTRFKGDDGEITTVLYNSGLKEQSIKYEQGIHLTNQSYLQLENNPYGLATMARIMPFCEAYNLLLAALIIAGQRQATPILIGKTDTSAQVEMLAENGEPYINPQTGLPVIVYQGNQMKLQLEEVQNGSVMVVDRLDEVATVAQQASPELLMSALNFLSAQMMLGFLVPITAISSTLSGLGDSNLSRTHLEIVREVMKRDVVKVGDALVEKAFKPELIWNHGELEDYGYFPIVESQLEDSAKLITAIAEAVEKGAIVGSEPQAADRIKQLAGIV